MFSNEDRQPNLSLQVTLGCYVNRREGVEGLGVGSGGGCFFPFTSQ